MAIIDSTQVSFVTSVFVCILILVCVKPSDQSGSTPHVKDIFLGRCWDFQSQKFPPSSESRKNCTKIWDIFYRAFAYKDPCNLTFDDYEPYFAAVGGSDIVNKSLFWSGTYKAVHSYSDFDTRFTTLEDTMAGWLPNNLTWCGNASLSRNSTDGIDYEWCPPRNVCDHMTPFWGLASRKFAEKASGVIQVMVNGTRKSPTGQPMPAYSRYSYFGKYELPNLRVGKVDHLRILVVHTIDKTQHENCGNGSIKMLREDAKARNITPICLDDPNAVKHILCADFPLSRECSFFLSHQGVISPAVNVETWKALGIAFICLSCVLLVTLILLLLYVFCSAEQTESFRKRRLGDSLGSVSGDKAS